MKLCWCKKFDKYHVCGVGAGVTKLANLVRRKELANPWVPFFAGLQVAILSLACFFRIIIAAFITKLTKTKLEVLADIAITRDQSHIKEGLWIC